MNKRSKLGMWSPQIKILTTNNHAMFKIVKIVKKVPNVQDVLNVPKDPKSPKFPESKKS